jgi:hypothetical protein
MPQFREDIIYSHRSGYGDISMLGPFMAGTVPTADLSGPGPQDIPLFRLLYVSVDFLYGLDGRMTIFLT